MRIQPNAARAEVRAFRALYQDHYGFVWSTVQRMGVRPDSIEDAVQDAFLVVFRRWGDLPVERRRAWLYGIARRVSSNARKIERRRARKHDALRHAHVRRVEVGGRLEAATVLERFLGQLAPEDRELFVLGVIEGLTGKELASALSAPASTLYGRLSALRQQFRAEAGELAESAVDRARAQRPRASAAGWAVLLPKLGLGLGAGSLGVALGGALCVAAVVGTAVFAAPPERASPVRPSFASTLEAPPRAIAVGSTNPPVVAVVPTSTPDPVEVPAAPVHVGPRQDPLAAEARLVQRIRERVRAGDADAALRLVGRHQRRHPSGVLSDVVVALQVEALCELGRHSEAESRAAALLHGRPETPVAQRLSRGCRSEESVDPVVGNAAPGHGSE